MLFHPWSALIDERSKIEGKSSRRKSDVQKFREELDNIRQHRFKKESVRTLRLMRFSVEMDWVRAGRPYYNVHPQMALKLAKANLDNIPARYIEIPNNFNAVHIRFSDDIPTVMMGTGGDGAQLAIGAKKSNSPTGARSALFGRYNFDDDPLMNLVPEEKGKDVYVLVIDEGARCMAEGIQRALCNTFYFHISPDQTIPEAINATIEECGDSWEGAHLSFMRERLENLFRIIITIGFLADSPDIVIPEVLSADKNKFDKAMEDMDAEAMERIIAKSRRRGKKGWNVGTSEMFVGERPAKPSSRGTGTGKELKWSHIRGGHPHAVRYGQGKTKVKIKWFRPSRVREDLPFKPEDV